MAKQYKLTTNSRFGNQGDVVTEQHLKDHGADFADLKARGIAEPVGREGVVDDESPVGDEANKERIELRIREETVKLGRPLEEHEKNKIAAEVTKESADQTKAATKDATAEQRKANAPAAKRDATQPPK